MDPNLSANALLINIFCFPQNAMTIMEISNQVQNSPIISTNDRTEGGKLNIAFIIIEKNEIKRRNL